MKYLPSIYFFILFLVVDSCFSVLGCSFSEDAKKHVPLLKKMMVLFRDGRIRRFLDVIAYCEGTLNKEKLFYFGFIPLNGFLLNNKYLQDISEYRIGYGYYFINSLKEHPNTICMNPEGSIRSSAAGRYQFTSSTWKLVNERLFGKRFDNKEFLKTICRFEEIEKELRAIFRSVGLLYSFNSGPKYENFMSLITEGFGPFRQDIAAIFLMFERKKVIADILSGRYQDAIKKLAPIWASLPANGTDKSYYINQKAIPHYITLQICDAMLQTERPNLPLELTNKNRLVMKGNRNGKQ